MIKAKHKNYFETDPCIVKLDDFEGPLDLLLFTLKEKKMTIIDLDVAIITDQYISYIEQFENLNLAIASEYLVMASYLIEIKSKSLLPKSVIEIDQEKYEEENRASLIKRLLEYNRFKNVASDLKTNYDERQKLLTKNQDNLTQFKAVSKTALVPLKLETSLLPLAIEKMLRRLADNRPLETYIAKPAISIEQLMHDIETKINNNKNKTFHLHDFISKMTHQHYAATFLLLLDFVNKHRLIVHQNQQFDDIYFEVI